jgi:hypothetical protein
MSAKKNIRSAKCSAKHSTFIEAAAPIISALERMPSVRRYVPGVITQGGRDLKMRVQTCPGALHIVVGGGGATQEIWVYPNKYSLDSIVELLQNQHDKWKGYVCTFS